MLSESNVHQSQTPELRKQRMRTLSFGSLILNVSEPGLRFMVLSTRNICDAAVRKLILAPINDSLLIIQFLSYYGTSSELCI
jgi:hypothetical protein